MDGIIEENCLVLKMSESVLACPGCGIDVLCENWPAARYNSVWRAKGLMCMALHDTSIMAGLALPEG